MNYRDNLELGVLKINTALKQSVSALTAGITLTASSPNVLTLGTAGGFAVVLPAPAEGLSFKFVVKVAPTTAYTITSASTADYMLGGVNELEVDTNDDGPSAEIGDTADVFTFVANVALTGDFVEMVSDGTYWYVNGQTKSDGGATIA